MPIGAVVDSEPAAARTPAVGPRAKVFPSWPVALLAVPIVVRALLFATALLTEGWVVQPDRMIPAWAIIGQTTLFGLLAVMLLYAGRSDRRAWSLGLFVLDAAATLLTPFVVASRNPSPATWLALHVRTDAFQAAMLWFFASVFPKPSARVGLSRLFYVGTATAFVLGLALVTADTYAIAAGVAPTSVLDSLAQSLQRQSPRDSDWYFTLQFILLVPLVAVMPMKFREFGPNDRRRCTWLAAGIMVGFLPLVVDTVLATLWPLLTGIPYLRQYIRIREVIILAAFSLVPLAGTYAALVQRTLDVRIVLRAALQYVLARSFIRALAAAPIAIVIILIVENRERSISDLLSGGSGATFAVLACAGAAAAIGRRRLVAMVDRRFFREQLDARATILSVADAVRQAASLDEFRELVTRAVEQAFHPVSVASFVAGADDNLHSLDAEVPSLARAGAFAQILGGSDAPIDIGTEAPFMSRMPARDREWIAATRGAIFVPLRGSNGSLLGIIALGEKRNELQYSTDDSALLAAAGSAAGLALDRILAAVRERTPDEAIADPAGRECVECGLVFAAEAAACVCGGLLQRAAVPLVLGNRLQFVQRIGSGGMGVVYRAFDLRLHQQRAVKTLPGTDPAVLSRMRREARTMAAVKHVNLATVHDLDNWRGAPMLVMEYLEGGSLADRLRHGPLPLQETARLGWHIADALTVLHGIGILHRDIKPSNIGFAADGTPKLLDFGLAKLAAPSIPGAVGDSTWSTDASSGTNKVRGTPPYLSPWALGGEPPSARDDCWSLAVTLLEACTGTNPFRAPTMAATVARILRDSGLAGATAASLPELGRQLFDDLLGPHDRQPTSAQQFSECLRKYLIMEEANE